MTDHNPDRRAFPSLARILFWEKARIPLGESSVLSPMSRSAPASFQERDSYDCGARERLWPPRRARGVSGVLLIACLAVGAVIGVTGNARAFRLHVPCTSSHDCPRGAFCRHQTSFRGQCIMPPQSPFGVTGRRLVEFPPESDPLEHLFGSTPVLRCSLKKPCPEGFLCVQHGTSKLEEALCVPYSAPCWSTADCSPSDICDKPDDEFSLTGVCRPRERAE